MSRVTAIQELAAGLDRVSLLDGSVLDVHRASLSLAVGQRARVAVARPPSAGPDAPYVVQGTVYERLGDSVYVSAGGLLHRLPGVDARIGDTVLVGVTPVRGRRRGPDN